MSYQLIDDDGPIDQLASSQGYDDLVRYINAQPAYPNLKALFSTAVSKQLKPLSVELSAAIAECKDAHVRATLENLQSLVKRAKLFIMIA